MKVLQSLFLCLFLSFGIQKAAAQVYKFKATSFSIMEKDDKGKWRDWSDFEESTVVITLDGKKDRITIASHEIQLYKITAYGEKVSTAYDETIPLDCVDNDGGTCTILVVTRKNQKDRKQFYINYKDVKIVYNTYVQE